MGGGSVAVGSPVMAEGGAAVESASLPARKRAMPSATAVLLLAIWVAMSAAAFGVVSAGCAAPGTPNDSPKANAK